MCRLAVLTATQNQEVAMKTMLSRLSRYRKLFAKFTMGLGLLWMTMPVPFAGLREKLAHWAVGGVEDISISDLKGIDSVCDPCDVPPEETK